MLPQGCFPKYSTQQNVGAVEIPNRISPLLAKKLCEAFFLWESFTFWSSHCPKPGSRGAADVALVPGCHCTALRSNTGLCHLPLPVVWSPKVGGRYCCCTQQRGTGQQAREKWAGERETASPLCWPPALLAPGGNASRPTLGCPTSVAQISTNGKSFRKPTRCKEETIQFIVTFFWFNKPDVFDKCTIQKIAAKDPHFVKNGVKASMWRQRVGLGNCAIRDSSGSEVGLTWNKETGCCWRSLDPLLFYCSSARGAFSQILHQVWDLILSVLPGEDWL